MSDETIERIKVMLGSKLNDCCLDDETIQECLEVAANRYDRGRWKFGGGEAVSWIFDYALANCKLILGEARTRANFLGDSTFLMGDVLIAIALEKMESLEKELEC